MLHPNTPPDPPTKLQPQHQPQQRDTSPPYPNTLPKHRTPAPPPQTTTQPPRPPATPTLPNILNTPPKDMRRKMKKIMTQNTTATAASKIAKACTSGAGSTILSYESASCGASTKMARKHIVMGNTRRMENNGSRRCIGVEVLGTNMMIMR